MYGILVFYTHKVTAVCRYIIIYIVCRLCDCGVYIISVIYRSFARRMLILRSLVCLCIHKYNMYGVVLNNTIYYYFIHSRG